MHESEFKNWISATREKYYSCEKLLELSKDDPPNEPYKSKYKAKDVFIDLLSQVDKWKCSENLVVVAIRALFKYHIGIIDLETEEITSGCDFLNNCWDEIKDVSGKPEVCVLALSVLNQLGILWCGRGEPTKAVEYLLEAQTIYKHYKSENSTGPYLFEDLFEFEDSLKRDWQSFEKIFTHTLYYLAQIYEQVNENDNSAKYCHETLKRQISLNDFEHKEWALNCATLSQYYIQGRKYDIARHLLACSSCLLQKYESEVEKDVENEEAWDELCRAKAEVSWCWLKYCINLLQDSVVALEYNHDFIDPELTLSTEKEVVELENEILCNVLNFSDARSIFIFGQSQVIEIKNYYTLDTYANNYVQVVQDYCKLYKALALHERDLGRLSKMNKRCINMLEDVLSKLNPQYYLAVCRQLRFELGETYYEMVDLKLKIGNSDTGNMTLVAVKKINSLIMRNIEHFSGFIDSLKDSSGNLPEIFTEDLVRPALVAHFYFGGLYSKLIVQDTSEKLKNLSKSEDNYKFIIEYTDRNPQHTNYVEKELPVIKEMIELMPKKIMQICGTTVY